MCCPCTAAGDGAWLLWSSDEIGSGTAGTPEPGGGAGLQDIGIGGARLLCGHIGEGMRVVKAGSNNGPCSLCGSGGPCRCKTGAHKRAASIGISGNRDGGGTYPPGCSTLGTCLWRVPGRWESLSLLDRSRRRLLSEVSPTPDVAAAPAVIGTSGVSCARGGAELDAAPAVVLGEASRVSGARGRAELAVAAAPAVVGTSGVCCARGGAELDAAPAVMLGKASGVSGAGGRTELSATPAPASALRKFAETTAIRWDRIACSFRLASSCSWRRFLTKRCSSNSIRAAPGVRSAAT